jgi:hypothetical protein
MQKSFKRHGDAGHSWIAVKISLLEKLNIATEVSPYSYMRGDTAYLEEDADATLFYYSFMKMFGSVPNVVESQYRPSYHWVRNLSSYEYSK